MANPTPLRALETAATVDTDAAALSAQTRRQRRDGTAAIAADIASKAALRCEQNELADLLFTLLPPDAYYRLVTRRAGPPSGSKPGWPTSYTALAVTV